MTDELDEYGVWVKSAPQSLDEPETLVLSKEGEPLQDLSELSDKTSQVATSEDSGFPADLLKNFLTDIEDIDEVAVSTIDETGQKAETETPDVPSISPALLSEEMIETIAVMPMDSELVNTEKAAIMESQNVHADLLSRIADELASIHDELTGIRQELKLSQTANVVIPEEHDEIIRNSITHDDIALIRDELTGIRQELSRSVASLATEVPKSNDLMLIRDELAGIRQELSRTIAKPAPEVSDDDKQIILTGDELSNIFNTAHQLHQESEDSSEESPDYNPAEETLPELNLISEISLDETPQNLGDEYLHIIKEADTDEMKKLYEEGVKPLTPTPEDTSYLDMSLFDVPDLSNAVIDDPIFSEKIEEHPLEEPSPEHIKNLSSDITDTTTEAERSDEPLIDGLLIDNDSTKDISIELDTDRLHAAYYEEEDELLELEEYEDEENDADQDIGDLLMGKNWEDALEKTNTSAPCANEPTPETGPKEEPEKEITNLSETSVSSKKESYDNVTSYLTRELKRILAYMDQILDSLPDDKVEAFTQSKHFTTYKQIFKTLDIS
ncbi:MAG: hypothetical protein LBK00_00630 [Treponema sp.]|jgi:hypothetical protein|nr:hypothetical protein [Treponema sp.]